MQEHTVVQRKAEARFIETGEFAHAGKYDGMRVELLNCNQCFVEYNVEVSKEEE